MVNTAFADIVCGIRTADEREEASIATKRAVDRSVRPTDKLRVFIVDDLKKFRTSFRFVLAAYGHDVEEASSPENALERLLDGAEFDIIFIDVQMKDKDGITLYHELRSAGVETPIVLMSALAQNGPRVKALDAPFFDKALDGDSLQRILKIYGAERAQ